MQGRFEFQEGFTYRMPVHFRGHPYQDNVRVVYHDCRAIMVEQKTDMAALAKYIPAEFEITAPVIQWSYYNCRGVDFMSNGEYRIFQASVPVRWREGDRPEGSYPLIVFEDDGIPILGGREEDGIPKVLCDISIDRHYENHWFAAASLYCDTMLKADFWEEAELPAEIVQTVGEARTNAFGNRYLPKVGEAGAAYQDYVLYPQQILPEKAWTGRASVRVFVPDPWYKNPYMYGALAALGGLPAYGFQNAMRVQGKLRLCVSDSKKLK
jgi:hypothetical protein